MPHFQDDLISGKHIFYTFEIIAATQASAGECEDEISVDEIYTDPYPGKSVANYLTVTQYAGEGSWLSYIDWINPLELIAVGGDIGRDYSRESEKELIGYSISVQIEDKAFNVFIKSDGAITGASYNGMDVTHAKNINASVEYVLQSLGK